MAEEREHEITEVAARICQFTVWRAAWRDILVTSVLSENHERAGRSRRKRVGRGGGQVAVRGEDFTVTRVRARQVLYVLHHVGKRL